MTELENIKAKLNQEIQFAQKQLLQNIESFSLSQSIEEQAVGTLTSVSSSLMSNPENLIPKLDTASRYFFDESNIIRKILKYAQLFIKTKNIFS